MNWSNLTRLIPSKQLVIGLIGGLVLTLFFLLVTASGSAVPGRPHHVPVAVVGAPPAAAQVGAGLQRGGAFRIIAAPTEATALGLVEHRKADAVINLRTDQLQTAPAASSLAAVVLEQIFASPRSAVQLHPSTIKPLASGDPQGLGLMFIALTFVLGGLPSGVVLAFMSRSRRPQTLADAGGRILTIVSFSTVQALLIALLADAILGYSGSQMVTVWGWGILLSVASMATTAALIAAVGVAGALLAALVFLFFGPPSSPTPSPWNFGPGFVRVLAPFAPMGVTVNGMKNGIFFGAASQAQNLEVLAAWIVAPILLMLVLGWRSERAAETALQPAGGLRAVEQAA